MPLETKFDAIVDATSGDTYLQPVRGRPGRSDLTVRGAIIDIKGRGHREQFDIDVPAGHIEDFPNLAVKTQPPVLTGMLPSKAQLTIELGKESVNRKLKSHGAFELRSIHFSNPSVQDKVDILSLRARDEPKAAKPGTADVNSYVNGNFSIGEGKIGF